MLMQNKNRKISDDEYFTSPKLIHQHIKDLDPDADFIDENAGIGNWLVEILNWKIDQGIEKSVALSQIYGIEYQLDTCTTMVRRLYGEQVKVLEGKDMPKKYIGTKGLKAVFELNGKIIDNIVCADCLNYRYTFGNEDNIGPDGNINPLFEF